MTNAEAWNYAIGIIKVDGLEPTEDFKEYIEKEKRGEITPEDARKYLDKKYKMKEIENAWSLLYEDVDVLRNKLNIKDQAGLRLIM